MPVTEARVTRQPDTLQRLHDALTAVYGLPTPTGGVDTLRNLTDAELSEAHTLLLKIGENPALPPPCPEFLR